MRTGVLIILCLLVAAGCHKQTKTTTVKAPEPMVMTETPTPPAPAKELEVKLGQTDVAAMWGMVTEVPITVEWQSGQKYAVQLAVADAPQGMTIETVPSIVEAPGKSLLRITPTVGDVPLHAHEIILEAAAYGMKEPVREKLTVNVIREDGVFVPVMAGPVTLECRNVCGKAAGGRVAFYDVMHEKEQSCTTPLPEVQRIGARSFAMSAAGFGFGRTCRLAAVFEPGGALTLVNIGAPTQRVPRGEVFVTIPNAAQCWLSPDNTLALAKQGPVLRLYDVYSGRLLGDTCTVNGDIATPMLSGKQVVVAGCGWEME